MIKRFLLLIIFLNPGLILQSQNISPSPYGINAHTVKNEIIQKIANAGIKWVRMDFIWSQIEPQPGKYDYTETDRFVNEAAGKGISILAVLGSTPAWANKGKGVNYSPAKVIYWQDFISKTVSRYKTKIKYWSIWNEPNLNRFFAEGKDVFVQRIFLTAARVIRQVDPGAFIVGPDLSHLNSEQREWYFWMKYILTQCRDYIDIISHHIYRNQGVYYIYELLEKGEHFIPSVKEVIEETGHGNKPFWITEVGWNTSEFSENTQANFYLEMLQKRKQKNYPHKIFFYEIIDDPASGAQPWGILRYNITEKPSYLVYRDFIAGKYPDAPPEEDDQKGNKKCYIEQTIGASNLNVSRNIFSDLRIFRQYLKDYSLTGADLVSQYYRLGQELSQKTLSDSRIFHLSCQLIQDIDRLMSGVNLAKAKMKPSLILKLKHLVFLLKQSEISPLLSRFLDWGETQLIYLDDRTLSDILFKMSQENDTASRARREN